LTGPGGENLKLLVSPEDIARRVAEMGQQITKDYGGEPLYVCCILKGAFVFTADLIRHIDCPIRVDFIRLASYGKNTTSSGEVKITKDVELPFKGCHVLVVEDIVDTGFTLKFLVERLKLHEPESVRICALLDKKARREVEVNVDYIGFDIPDKFVIGYGVDYAEEYRQLPGIYYIESE